MMLELLKDSEEIDISNNLYSSYTALDYLFTLVNTIIKYMLDLYCYDVKINIQYSLSETYV